MAPAGASRIEKATPTHSDDFLLRRRHPERIFVVKSNA
jgi:hypothetical protein